MTDHDLVHGGALDTMRARFPAVPEPWLDLSTGINPWQYPVGDIDMDSMSHLPTKAAYGACCDAMAVAFDCPVDALVLAPGSELLIRLLPLVLSLRTVAICSPTYADHAAAWQAAGAHVVPVQDPYTVPKTAGAVILCNPNNPDGVHYSQDQLRDVLRTCEAQGRWLIVDEAYCDLIPQDSLCPYAGRHNLIIFRSFGKFFGLAGLRLGAMLAPKPIRDAVQALLGGWAVSGAALEIGRKAYRDTTWQQNTRDQLSVMRSRLDTALGTAGFRNIRGTDLFRFVDVADASLFFERLAVTGIYVRRFDWSQTHVRIGLPGTVKALAKLRTALTL